MKEKVKELTALARQLRLETDGTEGMEPLLEQKVIESFPERSLRDCRSIALRISSRVNSRLGILAPYVDDDTINEIMVNGIDRIFYEDRSGVHPLEERFEDREELEDIIRNIAASVHREINEMNPILDARLENGSRVNAVFRNVALDGPVLTIRKFAKDKITIEQMISFGTITRECAECLRDLVRAGYNIFISGGTSSGKTTFLNALTDHISGDERSSE